VDGKGVLGDGLESLDVLPPRSKPSTGSLEPRRARRIPISTKAHLDWITTDERIGSGHTACQTDARTLLGSGSVTMCTPVGEPGRLRRFSQHRDDGRRRRPWRHGDEDVPPTFSLASSSRTYLPKRRSSGYPPPPDAEADVVTSTAPMIAAAMIPRSTVPRRGGEHGRRDEHRLSGKRHPKSSRCRRQCYRKGSRCSAASRPAPHSPSSSRLRSDRRNGMVRETSARCLVRYAANGGQLPAQLLCGTTASTINSDARRKTSMSSR